MCGLPALRGTNRVLLRCWVPGSLGSEIGNLQAKDRGIHRPLAHMVGLRMPRLDEPLKRIVD